MSGLQLIAPIKPVFVQPMNAYIHQRFTVKKCTKVNLEPPVRSKLNAKETGTSAKRLVSDAAQKLEATRYHSTMCNSRTWTELRLPYYYYCLSHVSSSCQENHPFIESILLCLQEDVKSGGSFSMLICHQVHKGGVPIVLVMRILKPFAFRKSIVGYESEKRNKNSIECREWCLACIYLSLSLYDISWRLNSFSDGTTPSFERTTEDKKWFSFNNTALFHSNTITLIVEHS